MVTYLENYTLIMEGFIAGLGATGFMTILQISIRLRFGLEIVCGLTSKMLFAKLKSSI